MPPTCTLTSIGTVRRPEARESLPGEFFDPARDAVIEIDPR